MISLERIVAHCSGEVWSKWLPYSEFKAAFPNQKPNYWIIAPEMLVLETDFPGKEENFEFAREICNKLERQKVSYKAYWTGNKSVHVEAEFKELAGYSDEVRPKVKEALAKHLLNPVLMQALDDANFKTKRMIAIPGTPHRTTGVCKQIWRSRSFEENKLPEEVKSKKFASGAITVKQFHSKLKKEGKCAFLEWVLQNKIPEGCRNQKIAPNLMALMPEKAEQFARVQEMPIQHVKGWKNTKFNCKQLQKNADQLKQRSICDLCLLGEC